MNLTHSSVSDAGRFTKQLMLPEKQKFSVYWKEMLWLYKLKYLLL